MPERRELVADHLRVQVLKVPDELDVLGAARHVLAHWNGVEAGSDESLEALNVYRSTTHNITEGDIRTLARS